ncbi:MAG: hypothetical protein ABR509_02490 [Candidatus Limnocylindria bacterium]
MKRIHGLLVGIAVPALILAAFGASSVAAGGDKVTLCHSAGGHKWVEITVSQNALTAHLNHGDVTVDEYGACP